MLEYIYNHMVAYAVGFCTHMVSKRKKRHLDTDQGRWKEKRGMVLMTRKWVRIRKKHFSFMPQGVNLACVSKLRSVLSLPCPKQPFLCLHSRLPVSSGTNFFSVVPRSQVDTLTAKPPLQTGTFLHCWWEWQHVNLSNAIVHLEDNFHF